MNAERPNIVTASSDRSRHWGRATFLFVKNFEFEMADSSASQVPGKRGRPSNPSSTRQKKPSGDVEQRGRGRPVDPNSNRQRRLASMPDEPRPRGRPVNPNSLRQAYLELKEERKRAGNARKGYSPGRPIDPTSARQRLLAKQAKKAKPAEPQAQKKHGRGRPPKKAN